MQPKLDFLVIGAQKCATSWLYYCLKEHPEILLPEDKVEHAYFGSEMFRKNGIEWYNKRFNDVQEAQKRGEVAVDYIYDTKAAHYLKQHGQNPQIIASLRDPADRFVSSYFWLIRKGKLPNIPIEEGIEEVLSQPPGFPNKLNSALEEVVRRGCYAPQLQAYMDEFSNDRIKVILYESIKKDSGTALREVYHFFGINHDFVPKSINDRPKKNSYNSFLINLERQINRKYLLGRALAKVANIANQALASKKEETEQPLSNAKKEKLRSLYLPQNEALLDLLSELPNDNRPSASALKSAWKL
jgi:hypothetical protein